MSSWDKFTSYYTVLISVLVLIEKSFPIWGESTNRGFLFKYLGLNNGWLNRKAYSLRFRSGLDLTMEYLFRFCFLCVKRAVFLYFSLSWNNLTVCDIQRNFKGLRKANRVTILKMPIPKLFIGLIYFQSKFQLDVGESWNNVSVIFQKISKKILKTVN